MKRNENIRNVAIIAHSITAKRRWSIGLCKKAESTVRIRRPKSGLWTQWISSEKRALPLGEEHLRALIRKDD